MYRIICIGDECAPRVLWKGPMGRKFEVVILQEKNHFDALKSISRFYKIRNFCVDCEKIFWLDRDHTKKCKVNM